MRARRTATDSELRRARLDVLYGLILGTALSVVVAALAPRVERRLPTCRPLPAAAGIR